MKKSKKRGREEVAEPSTGEPVTKPKRPKKPRKEAMPEVSDDVTEVALFAPAEGGEIAAKLSPLTSRALCETLKFTAFTPVRLPCPY